MNVLEPLSQLVPHTTYRQGDGISTDVLSSSAYNICVETFVLRSTFVSYYIIPLQAYVMDFVELMIFGLSVWLEGLVRNLLHVLWLHSGCILVVLYFLME